MRPVVTIALLLSSLVAAARAEVRQDSQIEFVGLGDTDEDDLRSAAAEDLRLVSKLIGSKAKADLILTHAEDAAFEMNLFLMDRGYPFSRIEVVIVPKEEGAPGAGGAPVSVRFLVTEGPLVLLDGVSVTGVDEDTAAELVRFVRAPRTSLLGSQIYVESNLDGASQRMRAWLRQRGHRDAAVRRLPVPEIEERREQVPSSPAGEGTSTDPAQMAVQVVYEAVPGAVHVLEEVEIAGCKVVDPVKLANRDSIRAYVGQPYGPFTPFDLESTVKDFYGKLGYPFVVVTANERVEPGGDPVKVLVTITVREGPLVRIGAVRIEGNRRTGDSVVRRELTIHPGEVFDVRKLEASQQRVLRTGLFRQAFIDIARPDRPGLLDEAGPIDADLSLKIEESDFQRFETSVGFGTWELLRAAIGYSWINVAGTGRTLAVELAGSLRGYRASLKGTEPWVMPHLLWDHTVGAAELSLEEQERPSFTYLRQAVGVSITKERLLHKLDASLTYVFRVSEITNVTGSVPRELERTANIGSLTLGVVRDARDNPWSPTKGSLISASLEGANRAFGGDIDFVRLQVRATQVFDLGAGVRFVAHAAAGAISPSGGQSELPLDERFYLGGGQTVRSFSQDDLGPRFIEDGEETSTAAGGEFYSLLNLEFRVPLWGDLEGAAFLDAGNVIENVRDAGLEDYRFGVGAGLRYGTPLGAVRVDFGVNPNPRDGEDRWAIFFAVGYPF